MLILLNACGADDLETTLPLTGINGEWTAVSFTTDIKSEVGDETEITRSQSSVTGYNFDYNLIIDENKWTSNGSYETDISAQTNGVITETTTKSYDNINGNGSYTTDNNTITVEGNLFQYEMIGLGITTINNDNLYATYEINDDGDLIFTQEESAESSINGFTIRTTLQSSSVWVRN